jgi:HEAT repeat protein
MRRGGASRAYAHFRGVAEVASRRRSTYRPEARTVTRNTIRRRGPTKLAALGLLLAMAAPAGGQPKPPAPPPGIDPAAAAADLARPETIASALASIHAAGPSAKKVAPLVEDLLARGLPPELAVAAIGALGAVRSPSASAAIAPYLSHRSATVRRAAAEALGNTGGPHATTALAGGLRSFDPAVRAASARALRLAGDRDSVPDLLRALDRGEMDAAPSVAAWCDARRCEELLQRWDAIAGPDRLAPAAQIEVVDALVARKPPLPDDVLLLAVAKLGASGDPAVKAHLRALAKDRKLSAKVRKAAEAALRSPERSP